MTSGKVPFHESVPCQTDLAGAVGVAGVAVEGQGVGADVDARAHPLETDEGVDGPRLTDDEIAEAVEVNRSTVERVRIRCVERGVEAALRPRPSRQLHTVQFLHCAALLPGAHLVALACSPQSRIASQTDPRKCLGLRGTASHGASAAGPKTAGVIREPHADLR